MKKSNILNEKVSVSSVGITKAVLIMLAAGAVVGAALLFPGSAFLFKEISKSRWEQVKKRGILRATIKRLERQKLISWREEHGKQILTLTEKGKKKTLQFKLEDLRLTIPKKWDGFWRVIVFDIPEDKKIAREVFRQKLKQMEFHKWQKSVFVTPWECKDEIDFLRHTFEIAPYVQYVLAKEIPGLDIKLFKKFERVLA